MHMNLFAPGKYNFINIIKFYATIIKVGHNVANDNI